METSEQNQSETTTVEDLQKQKLQLEVKQLNKSLSRRYFEILLPTIAPILIALGSLWLAATNGLFDVKKEKLQLDIARFESEKKEIIKESALLKSERDSLRMQNYRLRNQKDSLVRFVDDAIKQINKVTLLLGKIPTNYILLSEDGRAILTEDGKFMRTEDDPIIKKLKAETKSLQEIFDKSFDRTFQ